MLSVAAGCSLVMCTFVHTRQPILLQADDTDGTPGRGATPSHNESSLESSTDVSMTTRNDYVAETTTVDPVTH